MRAAALRSDPGTPRGDSVGIIAGIRSSGFAPFASLSIPGIALLSLLLLAILATTPPRSAAGAWLRAPGESYVKAALFRARGVEEFDAVGNRRPLFDPATVESGRYLESGGSLYLEHGLSRDVTLFASVFLKLADLEAHDHEVASDVRGLSIGIPDLYLGGRLPIARGRWAAALEPSLSIPLQAVDRRTDEAPAIGSGSASFAMGAAVGRSLPVANGYAQVGAGYRARAGKASDEWYGDAEAGLSPWGPVRLRIRYDRVDARRVEEGGTAGSLASEMGARDVRRIAPTVAFASRGGGEISLTYRRALAGKSALRGSEWELAYAFLGVPGR